MTVQESGSKSVNHLQLTDGDAVTFQGNDMVVVPNPVLKPGKTYEVVVPKHSLRYMTQTLSFSFSTRALDTFKPSVVLSYPSGGISYSKLVLDPVAPWLLFSEGVSANEDKFINFKEGG
jgi:hypothetical protein